MAEYREAREAWKRAGAFRPVHPPSPPVEKASPELVEQITKALAA